jgi:sulfur-oxidizing protein SoxY
MSTTRRDFLITAGGLAAGFACVPVVRQAHATPEAMEEAVRKLTGGVPLQSGRVGLVIPPLVDNANAVALTVTVESPMTPDDYVTAIHVFTEKNPLPNVVSAYLGPRAGRATVSTRIRLADTQTVTAVAAMSDGTFWSAGAHVVVTLAACLEEL